MGGECSHSYNIGWINFLFICTMLLLNGLRKLPTFLGVGPESSTVLESSFLRHKIKNKSKNRFLKTCIDPESKV